MAFAPDSTAVRVALWRALHVEVDAPPHLLEDVIGLRLADPPPGWRDRPDMNPQFTATFRASIVTRARFVEDLIEAQLAQGVKQVVLLGAGLDTFAQRRPQLAEQLELYEIDQPGPQAWKRGRLEALGYGVGPHLHLVPVNFEQVQRWRAPLEAAGFDAARPAVVVSTGVSMYLSREANAATLQQVATLAKGSTFVSTFLLPLELLDERERAGTQRAAEGAKASGTPWLSFFAPEQLLALAAENGLHQARVVPPAELAQRYFTGRTDGLRCATGEQLLVATV